MSARRVGTSYRQTQIDGAFDVVCIGSGIGALTAAALLGRHLGLRPLVLERHYTAGGFTHAFHRPGYEWDVGVHYVGEVNRESSFTRRLFDHLSDGALAWEDMGRVYDRVVVNGDAYDFVCGRRAFRDQIASHFPGEERAIDTYLHLVRSVSKRAETLLGARALPEPLGRSARFLARAFGGRALATTTGNVLRDLTSNGRLVAVLTGQWGDYGLPPGRGAFLMHALVANHYMEGAAYPVGGGSQIARTIVASIESDGGRVITNADVDRILVEAGSAVGVEMVDGRQFRARYVVSGAGAAITQRRLLRGDPGRTTLPEPSVSHLCLYVGLDRTDSELALPRHNLWVYPNDDSDKNFERSMSEGLRAPFPLLFISFPSAKDPDFQRRYPGRSTIEVATLAPWPEFERWRRTRWHKRGRAYEALKTELTERLLAKLEEQVPQVRGHITYCELSTPLSTHHFTGHSAGEIYGLAHTPARFTNGSLGPRTPVRNLFLTGSDVSTAGVAGACLGGLITASAIARRDLRKAI